MLSLPRAGLPPRWHSNHFCTGASISAPCLRPLGHRPACRASSFHPILHPIPPHHPDHTNRASTLSRPCFHPHTPVAHTTFTGWHQPWLAPATAGMVPQGSFPVIHSGITLEAASTSMATEQRFAIRAAALLSVLLHLSPLLPPLSGAHFCCSAICERALHLVVQGMYQEGCSNRSLQQVQRPRYAGTHRRMNASTSPQPPLSTAAGEAMVGAQGRMRRKADARPIVTCSVCSASILYGPHSCLAATPVVRLPALPPKPSFATQPT